MASKTEDKVFLSKSEADEHQANIKGHSDPYYEIFGRGVSKCIAHLPDGSIVSAWQSKYVVYSG